MTGLTDIADPPWPGSLRDRKKQQTRRAIVEAAGRLFAERGFRATSVDDIAAAANVSRRTVFTYFASKSDLLLVHADELVEGFVDAIGEWRPGTSLGPLCHRVALETLPGLVALFYPTDDARDAELTRMHEKLLARARGRWIDWEDGLASSIRETGGYPSDDPRPRLAAGLVLAAIRAAIEIAEQPPTEAGLEAALASAFSFLEPSLSSWSAPAS